MDRISQLPECIVHCILSFLHASPTELVRMSVLSKTWFHLTASFPVLDFNIRKFKSRENFFKYVEYTTSRFCHQNVIAHTFNLITPSSLEPAEVDIVNRCLELVLKKGVQVLVIDVAGSLYSSMPEYRLPNILLSVSVLKSLTICGCELPSSLMVDVVKFKSLIRLTLENVSIGEEVISYLTTSCPLLQEFCVRYCHGFKRFCVCGHQNLRKISIRWSTQVERIDIKAPNLSHLFVEDQVGRGEPQMNLAACKKLKTVIYFDHLSPNSNGYTDILSSFPFIENLLLLTSLNCSNLKLSSHSLRTLVLCSTCDLDNIEFRTPNLVLFIYSTGHPILCYPDLWSISCHMARHYTPFKPGMHCYLDGSIDALWFQKLRLFLDKKKPFKVRNVYFHAVYSKKFKELEKLKAIELSPYELDHVDLQLGKHGESSAHVAFVYAVLWCCRPRSLTLRSSFPSTDLEEQSDIVKCTYEKLLQQEDKGYTDIQIVSLSSSEAQKHFRHFISSPHEGKAISFIKEESAVSNRLIS